MAGERFRSAKGEDKIGAAALEVEVMHETVEARLVNIDVLIDTQLNCLAVFCPASKCDHQFHSGRATPMFGEDIEAVVLRYPYVGKARAGHKARQHSRYASTASFSQQDATCVGGLNGLRNGRVHLVRIDRVSAETGLFVKAKADGVNDLNVVNRGKTNLHRLISLMREPVRHWSAQPAHRPPLYWQRWCLTEVVQRRVL